jgi:putative tricarboxylic transport membrane protein
MFEGLLQGFQGLFQPVTFLYCFVGVFLGTLVGVLPGIGPVGAMSILLPATYGMSPAASIILLAGIYYGAQYGGSTTSILVNIPGEASSVITCLDGYQMARKGRAGPALGMAAFGSFIGGTLTTVALVFLAIPLSGIALKFGPPEFFSLICLSMTLLTYLGRGSFFDSLLMILLGLMLGTIGMDPVLGIPRFSFGSATLLDGVGIVPVAMGLFGISEIIMTLGGSDQRIVVNTEIKHLLPNVHDWRRSIGPIGRGSIIGFLTGMLPGGSAVLSTFFSYTIEKRISKDRTMFGKGAIEGVAGPETANNAAVTGAFVPLLSLGIPTSVVMAILLGALMIHGVSVGPLLITKHPEVFWGVIASMYLGNVMLLLLNLPLIGIWVRILKIPYRILMPLIILCCLIGVYASNYNVVDVIIMTVFGVLGYVLRKHQYELAPLIMALVLGPIFESHLRYSLIMSDGRFSIFVERPISAAFLAASALLIVLTGLSRYSELKRKVSEQTSEND